MVKDFEAFLDENTDALDTKHYAVFIRGVDCNLNITEKFLDLIPVMGNMTGQVIFQGLESAMKMLHYHEVNLVVWLDY